MNIAQLSVRLAREGRGRAATVPRCGALAVIALAVIASFALSCDLPDGDYFGKVAKHPDPTHLRWCNSGEPEYLDPALVTSTTGVKLVYAMFTGLTDHDVDGLPEPALASHWEITPDQRTFTFHLRSDAKWSNGRPITAHDFVYSVARVLHPLTASRNAEMLWKLKNGELYTSNRLRTVIAKDAPLPRGTLVEIVGAAGEVATDPSKLELSDSNTRVAAADLQLRDHPDWPAAWKTLPEPYATIPAGKQVTIIELGGADRDWAYVQWIEGEGVFGWVKLAELTGQPNGDDAYTVRPVGPEHVPGVTRPPAPAGTDRPTYVMRGRQLLMLPDALGVRAVDEHTVVFETFGPVPYLMDVIVTRAFRPTPREVVSRKPKRWIKPDAWPADYGVVTSGAFTLKRWLVRDKVELVKSSTYFDRDAVRLDRVTAFAMDDIAGSANYYFYGGCDATTSNAIPPSYLPVLRAKGYKDYYARPYLGVYFMLINNEKLSNLHLRRALNLAIDRAPLPSITKGGQIPSAQFMPGSPISELTDEQLALCGVSRDTPGSATIVTPELCYVPPPGLEFDLALAKQELALARQEMGANFPSSISLKFNSGKDQHKHIAEYLQDQWKRHLDLDVELNSQEWKTYLKSTTNGEYEIARLGWIGNFPDPEGEFLPMFKCDNPNNRTRFCNQEFDALYDQAEATMDRKQRLALIWKAEQIMIEQAAIIPLFVYTQHHLQKPFVRDLGITMSDQGPLRKAWIDPDWRKHAAEVGR